MRYGFPSSAGESSGRAPHYGLRRHSAICKYSGVEFTKRCQCVKHLRWTHDGRQRRMKTGARSWVEAEDAKRDLDAQLTGRPPEHSHGPQTLADAIEVQPGQVVISLPVSRYYLEVSQLVFIYNWLHNDSILFFLIEWSWLKSGFL